ncbi:MAG: SidA/IucD/PvdA family monooxygenase, partial [Pseudomonas sp.]|nr:SidA/IucD/PvdA family monooxygenase [Pseudomonas sp.]
YCRWASQQLPACHFGEEICDVTYDANAGQFLVESQSVSGFKRYYHSRDLAIGVGTAPVLPQWSQVKSTAPVIHSAEFGKRQQQLSKCQRVTVIGSGQSAAECVLALFSELTPERIAAGASIRWITRSAGFHPMEYSKLGQECFTPSYMEYFHSIPRERRRAIVAGQGLLYKGISFSTIADIYDLIYERSIGGSDPGLTLLSNCEVQAVEEIDGMLKIAYRHRELNQTGTLEADAIVAATGYGHTWPQWFERLKGVVLETDEYGDCIVQDDFTARRCDAGTGRVFVQNAEIFQHGVGSPDLGIAAIRNATIINQLLGQPYYRLPKRSSFQRYGMHEA